jgi:hypothetical protein
VLKTPEIFPDPASVQFPVWFPVAFPCAETSVINGIDGTANPIPTNAIMTTTTAIIAIFSMRLTFCLKYISKSHHLSPLQLDDDTRLHTLGNTGFGLMFHHKHKMTCSNALSNFTTTTSGALIMIIQVTSALPHSYLYVMTAVNTIRCTVHLKSNSIYHLSRSGNLPNLLYFLLLFYFVFYHQTFKYRLVKWNDLFTIGLSTDPERTKEIPYAFNT